MPTQGKKMQKHLLLARCHTECVLAVPVLESHSRVHRSLFGWRSWYPL